MTIALALSLPACAMGAGAMLAGRPFATLGRPIGAALIALGALGLASPALADQNVMAADNGTVQCVASARDLTRISLAGDQFASVSKITTGNPAEDFKIVNEPVRGDIYISVPDGFPKASLSFFGTTRKGFVYKFVCQVRGTEAEQVFIANAAITSERARDWEVQSSPEDAAVRLAQAMYRGEAIDGFDMRSTVLEPVMVGRLQVQQVGEYRGAEMKGLVLRVRNTGRQAQSLDENMLAARGALAFMAPVSELAAGQEAAVYLIQSNANTLTGAR